MIRHIRTRYARYQARFHYWIVDHLFPQRPFLTFGPGAELTDVTLREHGGVIVVTLQPTSTMRNIKGYDMAVEYAQVHPEISDALFQGRRNSRRTRRPGMSISGQDGQGMTVERATFACLSTGVLSTVDPR